MSLMTGETLSLDRQRNIRLTAFEDDLIEEYATAEGMTYSQFVRRILRRTLNLSMDGSKNHVPGVNPTFSSTNELSPAGAQATERGQLVELEGNAIAEGVSPVDAADAALVPPAPESEGTRGE